MRNETSTAMQKQSRNRQIRKLKWKDMKRIETRKKLKRQKSKQEKS